jgi:LysR family glycine cleavage system transcriptional activator
MGRDLPPFSAIRAFDAAARLLSFKRAAEELCVSHSAISHQIRNLEGYLGAPLFRRESHGVILTDTGAEYRAAIARILDDLDQCTDSVRHAGQNRMLRIQTTPAFASRWLVPKISHFNSRHPDIELHIKTSTSFPSFDADGIDFLVQYGMDPAVGLTVDPLLTSTRAPVCSPRLLQYGAPIQSPCDLGRYTLLHDIVGDGWDEWFRLASVDQAAHDNGPRFAHCDLSLRAAEEGQGVALAYLALIEAELASGTLVKLFDLETMPKIVYSMAYPKRWANRHKIAAFRAWLLEWIALMSETEDRRPGKRRAG